MKNIMNKKSLLAILSLLSATTLKAQTISPEDYLRQLVETKNEYLVDVRSAQEFATEHLNNAINIDFNSPEFEQKMDQLDKNRPLFIYCLSGGRSGSAYEKLSKKGFTAVYNMQGGILQWKAKNFPLNTTKQAEVSNWIGMTKDEFKQLTNGDIPVLVDFKAVWCGPCKMLKPELDALQEEYKGKIKIIEIDVDKNKSLADDMKIRSIPLMIYYKKGKVEMNIEGYADRNSIKRSLNLK